MSEIRAGGRAVLLESGDAPHLVGLTFDVLYELTPELFPLLNIAPRSEDEPKVWVVRRGDDIGLITADRLEGTEDIGDDENNEDH